MLGEEPFRGIRLTSVNIRPLEFLTNGTFLTRLTDWSKSLLTGTSSVFSKTREKTSLVCLRRLCSNTTHRLSLSSSPLQIRLSDLNSTLNLAPPRIRRTLAFSFSSHNSNTKKTKLVSRCTRTLRLERLSSNQISQTFLLTTTRLSKVKAQACRHRESNNRPAQFRCCHLPLSRCRRALRSKGRCWAKS